MGAFLTGGKSPTQAVIKYSGLQIGTSQFDIPIPIFAGQRRLSYNCIWYNDFTAHSVSAKGKGGKGGGQKDYTAAVIVAMCEGVVDSILNVWANGSTTTTTTLAALGYTFFSGTSAQSPWSYVVTKHPTQALSYADTAYLANPKLDLGQTATIPDNALEAVRLNGWTDTLVSAGWTNPTTSVNTPGTDISMADFIPDWLTSTQYGMGFTSGDFPDLTQFRAYQAGQGLYFSPYLVNQEKATDVLNRYAQMCNTWIYWNGSQFAFVPLGDSTVGGYTPDNDAAYDLGVKDYVKAPVAIDRIDAADAHNRTVVGFTDRTLGYVSNNAEWKDQTLVDQFGLRDNSTTRFDEICNPAVAATVAQLLGKRAAYVRKAYGFQLSYRFIRILPGTILTLTEPNLDLDHQRVRVRNVRQSQSGTITIEAEELPPLVGTYYPITSSGTFVPAFPNTLVDPGNVNTPAVIEPDSKFTAAIPQLLIAASGGANWGGCTVYIAFNGTGSYTPIGKITAGAAQGVLTAPLASHASPDNVNTLSVDLTESLTIPQPVTHDDADALRTLSLIAAQPTIVAGAHVIPTAGIELLAFGTEATTGTYAADLTYLIRGQLGTSPGAHSSGDQFTVIDTSGQSGTTIAYDIPAQYIGSALSLKFASFNTFDGPDQDLSLCVEYQYTPTGAGFGGGAGGVPTAPTGTSGTPSSGQNLIAWSANPSTDNVTTYKVYRGNGTGTGFGSCTLQWSGLGTSWMDTTVATAQAYTYYVVATNVIGDSLPSAAINVTSTTVKKDWQPQGYWLTPVGSPSNEVFALPTKTGHSLPINLTGSVIGFESAPAADWTANLYADATPIGTATVLAGHLTGTFTFASTYNFTGELFKFIAPAVADASASGLYFLFVGTRTQ